MTLGIISMMMCVSLCGQVFHPIQDSYVFENLPDTNFGSSDTLCIRSNLSNWNYITRSLVKFDLTPISPGTPIQSAVLGLYMFFQAGTDFDVEVYRLIEPWNEMGVTWNNQPQFDSTAITSLPYQGIAWWEFDITDLVQDWVDNPGQDYGALLKFAIEQYPDSFGRDAMFYSYDTTINQPYLDVQTAGIEEQICTKASTFKINPNPFHKRGFLEFSTAQDCAVTALLYDISGRQVATIFNGTIPAGYHKLEICNGDYSSGIYFLKINIGDGSVCKRFTILE
jgi:hypothetical protein